ncbi:hypothetical protein L6R50_14275 [Myxococcota bacterium]|nr:hypothetical protein [Myxococcota bacterium]
MTKQADGVAMYQALMSVRRLHAEVALLLRTCDDHLRTLGYRPRKDNTALAELSYSVVLPDRWTPEYAFRLYQPPKDHPDRLVFVSVVLCPRQPEAHRRPFVEPLVSAGWVRFRDDKVQPQAWAPKMIGWTDCPRDGSPARWVNSAGTPNGWGWEETWCLALPLVRVSDSEKLVQDVLKPLTDSLVPARTPLGPEEVVAAAVAVGDEVGPPD